VNGLQMKGFGSKTRQVSRKIIQTEEQ